MSKRDLLAVQGTWMFLLLAGCTGQAGPTAAQTGRNTDYDSSQRVGGPCEEGYCELMYLGMPAAINATDTSPGWNEPGQRLLVTGTVYQMDGKTAAEGVIIYYHHTDKEGLYSPQGDRAEDRTRHGHIRGWMKTGKDGRYSLYTSRPAPYPDRSQPAHIHWMIKEPDVKNEYWTDDLMFQDDPLLQPWLQHHRPGNMGGSGVVPVAWKGGVQLAVKDFVLGRNVPNYPKVAVAPLH
jgi:protocatechuate 3,4-dioxygenase beta subunit